VDKGTAVTCAFLLPSKVELSRYGFDRLSSVWMLVQELE